MAEHRPTARERLFRWAGWSMAGGAIVVALAIAFSAVATTGVYSLRRTGEDGRRTIYNYVLIHQGNAEYRRLTITLGTPVVDGTPIAISRRPHSTRIRPLFAWRKAGITHYYGRQIGSAIPLWLVCLSMAAASAACLRSAHHARRARIAGLCAGCGYDLRATPTRCPECGRKFVNQA